ncbi:hypothetical protein N9S45_01845 [Candidatus Actinomarina sp.]|nr:hypothetical protein [Candidatus Actinomarina sp.]
MSTWPNLFSFSEKDSSEISPRALIGVGTGEVTDIEDLNKIRDIVPKGKLAIGSGLNGENIQDFSQIADIGIIGTDFKVDGFLDNPVDTNRVKNIISKIS